MNDREIEIDDWIRFHTPRPQLLTLLMEFRQELERFILQRVENPFADSIFPLQNRVIEQVKQIISINNLIS